MRGEHLLAARLNQRAAGSSPHARGARDAAKLAKHLSGIIPACAGSTANGFRFVFCCWDHPRMRGEHYGYVMADGKSKGSSPHARGAPELARNLSTCDGIIPACAGSTGLRMSAARRFGDHPRMRGEHSLHVWPAYVSGGSSPHARGAHREVTDICDLHGIIPACAGSTTGTRTVFARNWDHPRMRGEHRLR